MTTTHNTDFLAPVLDRETRDGALRWMTQPIGAGQVRTFTWREGLDEARRIATWLRSLSLPPKSHIALVSKNTAWWILCDLAIWMAGHVSVPIYPTLSAASVKKILEHSDARLLFVGKLDDWPSMKRGVPQGLPMVALPLCADASLSKWTDIVQSARPLDELAPCKADELATIVYTSGSTGEPKGVMLTFGAMAGAMDSAVDVFGFGKQPEPDRLISYLPLAHVMERCCVEMCSLGFGCEVFFAESLDTFADDLRRARPTIFVSVPRLWLKFQAGVHARLPPAKLERLLRLPLVSSFVKRKVLRAIGLDAVRFAFTGSAPLPAEVLAWYRRLGLELLEAYGMSENFCLSHISKPGRVRAGFVGEPWPGVECRIAPDGEVQMRGPALLTGYYKAPELTAAAFTDDGFLKTGDRGELDDAGRLRITGRTKELFKTSGGKYVAPAPIESLLLTNEYLESGCVMGAGRPQPCAVVTVAEAYRAKLDDAAARARIAASIAGTLQSANGALDKHEALRLVVIAKEPWSIESGLLTPTMKIRRNVVEDRYGPALDDWYGRGDAVIWE